MTHLNNRSIEIIIADDSHGKKCDIGCGLDWSSAEVITLADRRIKERFGDKLKLEYIDLSESPDNPDALELSRIIKNKNLALPLLLINGEPKISGPFDIRLLLEAIETEIEIKP